MDLSSPGAVREDRTVRQLKGGLVTDSAVAVPGDQGLDAGDPQRLPEVARALPATGHVEPVGGIAPELAQELAEKRQGA